jgi:hypothetical protein
VTLEIAESVARRTSGIMDTWQKEQVDARQREAYYLAEVQRRKSKVAQLKQDLEVAQRNLREEKQRYYAEGYRSYYHTQHLQQKVNGLTSEIEELKKAPAPVYQPLPRSESLALRVLFFLFMPPIFQKLGEISCLSQDLLLPSTSAVSTPLWKSYYLQHRKDYLGSPVSSNKELTPGTVCANYNGKPAAVSWISPATIYSASVRVWFPDTLSTELGWQKSADSCVNPFVGSEKWKTKTDRFTGTLSSASLQVFLLQYGLSRTESTRGNLGPAYLHLKPPGMLKASFLAFASLRAYPHQQLRKICAMINENTIIFGAPEFRTLV